MHLPVNVYEDLLFDHSASGYLQTTEETHCLLQQALSHDKYKDVQ